MCLDGGWGMEDEWRATWPKWRLLVPFWLKLPSNVCPHPPTPSFPNCLSFYVGAFRGVFNSTRRPSFSPKEKANIHMCICAHSYTRTYVTASIHLYTFMYTHMWSICNDVYAAPHALMHNAVMSTLPAWCRLLILLPTDCIRSWLGGRVC